jgi:hypothetical protein
MGTGQSTATAWRQEQDVDASQGLLPRRLSSTAVLQLAAPSTVDGGPDSTAPTPPPANRGTIGCANAARLWRTRPLPQAGRPARL